MYDRANPRIYDIPSSMSLEIRPHEYIDALCFSIRTHFVGTLGLDFTKNKITASNLSSASGVKLKYSNNNVTVMHSTMYILLAN